MAMERRALALADELGLRGRRVFFNEGWVPYDRARRVPARGRRRRLGPLRRARDALRVPHAPARLLLGRAADRHHARRRARRARRGARLGRAVGARATSTRGPRRSTDVLDDATGRAIRAAASPAPRRAFAWPRVVEPLRRARRGSRDARPAGRPARPIAEYALARRLALAAPRRRGLAQRGAAAASAGGDRARTLRGRPEARQGEAADASRYPEPVATTDAPAAVAERRGRAEQQARVLRVIAGAEFKLKYAGSALGYVWSVAQAARAVRDALRGLRAHLQARGDLALLPASRC